MPYITYNMQSLKWKQKPHGCPLSETSPKGESSDQAELSFPSALSFCKHVFPTQSEPQKPFGLILSTLAFCLQFILERTFRNATNSQMR